MVDLSGSDLFAFLILVVPGFVLSYAISRIASYDWTLKEPESYAWSILGSIVVYFVYSSITGLHTLPEIYSGFYDLYNLTILILVSVGIALAVGLTLKSFRLQIHRTDVWKLAMYELSNLKDAEKFVLVYTKDGREYKGRIKYVELKAKKKDFIIDCPQLILRDDNWTVTKELDMGKMIYFNATDVRRVLFFDTF